MNKKLYLSLIIILFIIFYSCDNDQVEEKYKDFNSAYKNGMFDSGWIPKEVISKEMSNIYLRTNVDLNNCFFVFSTSGNKLDSISGLLSSPQSNVKEPIGIDVTEELLRQAERLDFYFLKEKDKRDSVFIAIDKNAKMIFGIRK